RINGRLCADSSGSFRYRHSGLTFPVKLAAKSNENPFLLLQKIETGKGQVTFASLGANKGKLAIIPLKAIKKSLGPRLFALGDSACVLVYDLAAGGVVLEKRSW